MRVYGKLIEQFSCVSDVIIILNDIRECTVDLTLNNRKLFLDLYFRTIKNNKFVFVWFNVYMCGIFLFWFDQIFFLRFLLLIRLCSDKICYLIVFCISNQIFKVHFFDCYIFFYFHTYVFLYILFVSIILLYCRSIYHATCMYIHPYIQ